jgi:fatty-acyl-CoA synthase
VALLLRNRSAYLELLFAAARLGAIASPLNARLTAAEIRHPLSDSTPAVLAVDSSLQATADVACAELEAPPARIVCGGESDAYEQALAAASPWRDVASVSPDDPMILMYTSGTTGVPKGALLPHRKTLYNSLNANLFFGLEARDRVLVVLPLFHSFGLAILAIPTLHAGASVWIQQGFDPERVWSSVAEHEISFFGGVPTMFRALLDTLDAQPGRWSLHSLRFLFTAGAAIPVELVRAFEAHGLVLKQGFGQTETSILCCLEAQDALRKAGSVGRPVHHVELRVIQRDTLERPPAAWQDVAVGQVGEIVARGPITMIGYWQRPDATAEVLRDGWLRTGDLATLDDEGFLTLEGRARDMYISGGENVYPAELEAVYEEHPAIREIAVKGVPDGRWGETGHAFCVLERGHKLDAAALREWGAQRLASFKLPSQFSAVPELPRTESGKVQKHLLGI